MDIKDDANDRHWTPTVQMDFEYVLNDRHWTLYSSNGLYRCQNRTYIGLNTVQLVVTDASKGHALDSIYTVQMDVEDVLSDIHWTLYSSNKL